jgi:hypothetical protein
MNKTLTIIVAVALTLLLAASAFGEIGALKKGSWYMGGAWTAGFAKQGGDAYKDANDKTPSTFYIAPSAGYFFTDGLAVGALLGFESYTWGDYKSTSFGFGPKLYYYFGAANDIVKGKMVPYATGSFTFNSHKTEYPGVTETVTTKTSGSNIHLGLGGIYMFANSFGVFGEAYYEMQKSKQKEPVEFDSVSGSEFGIMIGVNAFFSLGK